MYGWDRRDSRAMPRSFGVLARARGRCLRNPPRASSERPRLNQEDLFFARPLRPYTRAFLGSHRCRVAVNTHPFHPLYPPISPGTRCICPAGSCPPRPSGEALSLGQTPRPSIAYTEHWASIVRRSVLCCPRTSLGGEYKQCLKGKGLCSVAPPPPCHG